MQVGGSNSPTGAPEPPRKRINSGNHAAEGATSSGKYMDVDHSIPRDVGFLSRSWIPILALDLQDERTVSYPIQLGVLDLRLIRGLVPDQSGVDTRI